MIKLLMLLALTATLVSCGNKATAKSELLIGNCYSVTFNNALYLIRLTDQLGNNTFKYDLTDGTYLIDKGTWFNEGENYDTIDCNKVEFREGLI